MSCSDALEEVKRLNARNEDLKKDADNKRDDYQRQIDAIVIPPRTVMDYFKILQSETDVKKMVSLIQKWESEGVMVGGQIYEPGINALVASAENKRNELINLKNGVKYEPVPVPNIGCCQTMNFDNLEASQIIFDKVTQSCTTPNAPSPAPSSNESSDESSDESQSSSSMSKNKKIMLTFIITIICLSLLIGGFLILDANDTPTKI